MLNCEHMIETDFMCIHTQSCLTLVTLWIVAHQASLSMGFSREEYWSSLPFIASKDLPNPGIKPRSPALYSLIDLIEHTYWRPE